MKNKRTYRGKVITIEDVPDYMYKTRPGCKDILKAYIEKMESKVKYHHSNRDKVKTSRHKHYLKHKDRLIKETMEYYLANKEYLDKKNREWYWENRDERLVYGKSYRDSHEEEILEYRKIHYAKPETKAKKKAYRVKWESIPFNSIRHKMQSSVNTNLKKYTEKGHLYTGDRHKGIDYNAISKHLLDLVDKMDISYKEIKETHHVDHIIPMYYYKLEEIHKAFNPLNLRWLPAKENMSRQNNITDKDWEIIKALPKEIYPKNFKALENIK